MFGPFFIYSRSLFQKGFVKNILLLIYIKAWKFRPKFCLVFVVDKGKTENLYLDYLSSFGLTFSLRLQMWIKLSCMSFMRFKFMYTFSSQLVILMTLFYPFLLWNQIWLLFLEKSWFMFYALDFLAKFLILLMYNWKDFFKTYYPGK